MNRTKVFAVAAALVAAGATAIALAGGAAAASWHVYQGDMYAGHAYGLQVPAGAESIEFSFDGPAAGAASIGVYDPSGARVGHYVLDDSLSQASIANPAAGQYSVYVYDVTDGALSVRVASQDKPAMELSSVPLAREDTKLGSFDGGKLDRVITADLATPPVFVTLLYEGSARSLAATVASEKGTVVTITDETATAFSPGVWTTSMGERKFDSANVAGRLYTIEVHAAEFEGTMVLTTLALQLPSGPSEPMATPVPPTPPKAPAMPAREPVFTPSDGAFAIHVGEAVAFEAPVGTLQLVDAELVECQAEQQKVAEGEREECYWYSHAAITLYTPDDLLLASVILDHDNPVAEIALPVQGEYVAYTHWADSEMVLARILGASAAPKVRILDIVEESYAFTAQGFFGGEQIEIDIPHVPLMMQISLDGLGALASAILENDNGLVAWTDGAIVIGRSPIGSGTHQMPENFAKGSHTLSVDGLYEGDVEIVSYHYVRETPISDAISHPHEHAHENDDEEDQEETTEETEDERENGPLPPFLPRPPF